MEASVQGEGEVGKIANVNSAGQVYLGKKYEGKTVKIAFEVQEE